jgi:RND family efflux transporter MFP subunit
MTRRRTTDPRAARRPRRARSTSLLPPPPSAPRRSRRALLAALPALAAAVLLAGCGDDGAAAGAAPPFGGGRPPAVVRAAAVEEGPFVARAEFVGALEARSQADLYARSSGPIVEITADIGDRVRQGQVLARIEPAEERERIEQARANLRMAEATLAQRRAALTIAETTARRTEALAAQELVSEQQADAVDAEMAGARAQVQLAEAQVEQVRSALSSAQVELDQTLVVAPFDGVVGRRFLDRGAFAAANSPVLSVVDLSTIKTTVPVPERDAAKISVGQPATVRVGSIAGAVFPGRVARKAEVFDPESATTRAEIEVDNPDGRLKPGMFATVSITFDDGGRALLVPAEAVLDEDGRSWLFVLEPGPPTAAGGEAGDGDPAPPAYTAHRIEVRTLGAADGGRVAVEGRLEAGQRVVVLGHEALADGAPVVLERHAGAEAGP